MTEQNQDESKQTDSGQDTASAVASSAPPSVQENIRQDSRQANRPANQAPVHKMRLSWVSRIVLTLSFVVAVLAAALVAYRFYLAQQEQIQIMAEREALSRDLQSRDTRLSQLENQVGQLSRQLQQERDAIKTINQSREMVQARVSVLEKDIAAISGAHRIDWMLREVEHFINVAEQRLTLLGDARGALALMTEADDIVRAMREPATRTLREALVKDIHQLKLAADTSVDVEGIFLRLSDLTRRVEKLGIPRFELKQEPLEPVVGTELPPQGWELFWYRFKQFAASLYNFQRHPKGRPAVLTEDRDFLARNVIMLLQQAQLALLRGDAEAYRVSLAGARDRVELYIHQRTGEAQFFVSEISELMAVKLRPPMPTIEESSRAVRVFREYWNKEKLIREQQAEKLEQDGARGVEQANPTEVAPVQSTQIQTNGTRTNSGEVLQ